VVPIERTPLTDHYGAAAVLDLTHKKGRADITPDGLRKAADKAGVDLQKVKIVLVRTDLSKGFGKARISLQR
jgi:kynurenine formamidase